MAPFWRIGCRCFGMFYSVFHTMLQIEQFVQVTAKERGIAVTYILSDAL